MGTNTPYSTALWLDFHTMEQGGKNEFPELSTPDPDIVATSPEEGS